MDSKLGSKVCTSITKANNQVAFMLVSVVEDKLIVSSAVPDAVIAAGLTAGAWVGATMVAVGGRGGGKEASAQGQVGDVTKLDALLAIARSVAAEKLA